MSVKLLFELRERLHYTAIAGILTAGEDFRLHNVLKQFQEAAGISPVFARMNGLLEALRSPEGFTGRQLMEAASLVDAVCTTQAAGLEKAAVPGKAEEPAEQPAGNPTGQPTGQPAKQQENSRGVCLRQFRYSEVKPFLNALREKGSGRYSILWEAWQAKSEVLSDYRLTPALIAGLGDSYGEMADLCMEILKQADESIVPILKKGLDPNGKKEMARRVTVIASIAKERENDYYMELIESGSGPVRQAAIRALCFDSGNQALLAALAKSERGEAKKAALTALMRNPGEAGRERLFELLKKDPALAAPYLFYLEDEETADWIGDQIEEFCTQSLPAGGKSKEELAKLSGRLKGLLDALPNKYSKKLFECLARLGGREKELEPYGGKELLDGVNLAVAKTVFLRPHREILDAAASLSDACGAYLPAAVLSSLIRDFTGIYDACGGWLKKRDAVPFLGWVFDKVSYDRESRVYAAAMTVYALDWDGETRGILRSIRLGEKLDIRWVKQIMASQDWNRGLRGMNYLQWYGTGRFSQIETLKKLTDPEDEELCDMLRTYYRHYAMQGRGEEGIRAYLELGGTECKGMIPALLKAKPNLVRYPYQFQTILALYEQMPMTREEKAQEMLQTADRMEKQEIKATNQIVTLLRDQAVALLSRN